LLHTRVGQGHKFGFSKNIIKLFIVPSFEKKLEFDPSPSFCEKLVKPFGLA
jgi:hypothetical protein